MFHRPWRGGKFSTNLKVAREMSITEYIRRAIRLVTNRKFRTPEEMYRKRVMFGEINEMFKRQLFRPIAGRIACRL